MLKKVWENKNFEIYRQPTGFACKQELFKLASKTLAKTLTCAEFSTLKQAIKFAEK